MPAQSKITALTWRIVQIPYPKNPAITSSAIANEVLAPVPLVRRRPHALGRAIDKRQPVRRNA